MPAKSSVPAKSIMPAKIKMTNKAILAETRALEAKMSRNKTAVRGTLPCGTAVC
jgi:hypothetical protein